MTKRGTYFEQIPVALAKELGRRWLADKSGNAETLYPDNGPAAPRCPRCQSARTDTFNVRNLLSRLSPRTADYFHCDECSHLWVVPRTPHATP